LSRNGCQQWVVHRLALRLSLLVEVEHLDEVGGLAGQFLVADGVRVELIPGDVLGPGALT